MRVMTCSLSVNWTYILTVATPNGCNVRNKTVDPEIDPAEIDYSKQFRSPPKGQRAKNPEGRLLSEQRCKSLEGDKTVAVNDIKEREDYACDDRGHNERAPSVRARGRAGISTGRDP